MATENHRRYRVLLVEDNEGDARLFQELLKAAGTNRFLIRTVDRLATAIAVTERETFDVLVLDLSLPDSQGLDTFLTAHERISDPPIIVLTGLADEDLAVRAVSAGAQDYLVKGGLDAGHLHRAVRHAVERHAIETTLRKTQGRLQQVLSSSPAVLYAAELTDGNLSFSWASENCERLLGVEPAALLAPGWLLAHVHPADRDDLQSKLESLPAHELLSLDYRLRRSDGEYLWIHDDARVIRASAAGTLEIVGAWLDVTERKQAEHALRESEQRFLQLAENVREVFFISEPETGRSIYLSPAYEAVFGHSREHAYATPNAWLEGIHPEDRARMSAAARGTAGEGATEDLFRVLKPDGSFRWVRARASPVRSETGGSVRIVGIAEDVTELRRTQDQLIQAQKMEAVGRLAGGVAHDFNNLLTVIVGHGELLAEDLRADDPAGAEVREILEAASRATALTRQLLAFSRQQVLEPRVLDLNALVADMNKLVRRLIGEDLDLRCGLAPDLGPIRADPSQLEQVIMNLVVNARDAMPDGGQLVLETANAELDASYARVHEPLTPGPYVMLAVSDNGIGMTDDVKARIFEPFFTTKEAGKGTGLGLATVYGIVKQSGGYVWVYSEAGHGTTIKVYFPRVTAAVDGPVGRSPAADDRRGVETVLLVEDEAMVRSLAAVALTRRGYRVLEAANGGEALLTCERHREPIHLLVTDVIMPGMTGPQLAVRLQPLHPEMKVLYVSGYAERAMAYQELSVPGVSYLSKPFTPTVLTRKVRDVLDGRTVEAGGAG